MTAADPALLAAMAILLLTAAGAGHLARRVVAGGVGPPLRSGAVTLLAGFAILAALLSNLSAVGVPRAVVLGVGYGLGAAGLALLARERAAVARPEPVAVVTALLAALALLSPLVLALELPILAHDAILIWWPKMEEVAAGRPPVLLPVDPLHAHAEYPRGLAWLASTAWPVGSPDPRVLKLVPWTLTWLTAVAMAALGRVRGVPLAGALAALLLAVFPDVAQWSHSGYADLPLAAMILLAGIGLSLRSERREGALLAVLGAIGAASIKEEGAIVAVAVAAALAMDAVFRRDRRRSALAALPLLAVIAPWWHLRARAPGGVLGTAGHFLAGPELLALRIAEVARDFGIFLVDPGSLVQPGEVVRPMPPSYAAWAVLAAVLVLLPRGRREVVAGPAALLLLVDLAIYVVTPNHVRWHVRTSLGRLLIQVLPLLLAAAAIRMARASSRPAPSPPGDPTVIARGDR